MKIHTIDVTCTPKPNIIRETYSVEDTSSSGENCGLFSLRDIVGNDPSAVRTRYSLPLHGRLSSEELGKVLVEFHQMALMVVEVHYSPFMEIDGSGKVLVSGYGVTTFVPNEMSNASGFVVLLNEHGHFSPVTAERLILPKDIIGIISKLTGSTYEVMRNTIFTDFHTPNMKLTGRLRTLFGLIDDL